MTIRGKSFPFPETPDFPREFIYPGVNALVFDQIARALASIRPQVVINCIGLIKQTKLAKDPLSSIQVNALLPHQIALICQTAGIRMIHISTDCVFSGSKGNYTEDDQTDPVDLYGRTKLLGEMVYPHTVTLRTSIIGRELKTRLGLIEWFLSQKGMVNGFQKAIYSGFSTDELARIIENTIIPDNELSGLYHVSSQPISKYELLKLAAKAFDHDIKIHPYQDFACDRSLDSERFRRLTGYQPPSWPTMIDQIASGSGLYD